jgi:pimeloyl-ACP methyl ester carboxylesterase
MERNVRIAFASLIGAATITAVLLCQIGAPIVAGADRVSPTNLADKEPAVGGSFAVAPCPNPIVPGLPQFDLGPEFECGYLTVPENRAKHAGPSIRIPIARLKAAAPNPKPDPIVFLAGGPGGSALLEQSGVKGWNADRDVIFVGQRGTIKAEPFLSCPEVDDFRQRAAQLESTDSATVALADAAVRACHDRLISAGWDLSSYNTTENAADIADLRTALGITQWNVYAVSYGTDLAMQLLRDHPDGIRAVVLDGVVPPQLRSIEKDWSAAAEGYHALFGACAADAWCNSFFPNGFARFTKLVDDLTVAPRKVTVDGDSRGHEGEVVIDGFKLADLVVRGSNDSDLQARIPSLLHDLAEDAGTRAAAALLPGNLPIGLFGYGLQWGVQCSEYVPFTSQKKMLADAKHALPDFPDAVLSLLPQAPYVFADCKTWDVKPAPKRITQPARSGIPILLVSGALDSLTPPSWAEVARTTLTNAHYIVFPAAGHGVFHWAPGCLTAVMLDFLDRPNGFDDRCVSAGANIPHWNRPNGSVAPE